MWRVKRDLIMLLGVDEEEIIPISAKTGLGSRSAGSDRLTRASAAKFLRKAIEGTGFDSHYDSYKGVIAYVQVLTAA